MNRKQQSTFALALWSIVMFILALLTGGGYAVFAAVVSGMLAMAAVGRWTRP